MKKEQKKIKKEFQPVALAAFLREMADVVDGRGPVNSGQFHELLQDFMKLSLKVKRGDSGLSAKIKVEKFSGDGDEPVMIHSSTTGGDSAEHNYKALKKQMKSVFREIGESLANGSLPSKTAVDRFLDQSSAMVRYPGYGDDQYDAYRAACARFAQDLARSDLAAVKDGYAELVRLKNDCHRQYK
jgi:XXXCH domain-containing protein